MSMYIVPLTPVTDTVLTASSVPETDHPEWLAGSTYAVSDRCIRAALHAVYERVVAGGGTTPPESDAVNWLFVGKTNRWAMFDDKRGTKTTSAVGTLSVTLRPGPIGAMGLIDLAGAEQAALTIKDGPGGAVVETRSYDLDGSVVTSVYDWFFAPVELSDALILTDLPESYWDPEITLTLTGPGAVDCGVCRFGRAVAAGATRWEPQITLLDWSVKDTDQWGGTSFVEGDWARRIDLVVEIERADTPRVLRALAAVRGKPALYVGTSLTGLSSLLSAVGKFNDVRFVMSNAVKHVLSIQIEELT